MEAMLAAWPQSPPSSFPTPPSLGPVTERARERSRASPAWAGFGLSRERQGTVKYRENVKGQAERGRFCPVKIEAACFAIP
ncbi:hypothetical protein NL676_006329 [Syzygium grande]|nr:hypothetical protein NL676_006329 [Syzygium grande]